MIPPTWQHHHAGPVSPRLARVTQVLFRIAQQVTGPQGYARVIPQIRQQGPRLVHDKPGKGQRHVATVIGDLLDTNFKSRIEAAQLCGDLPRDLRVAGTRGKGPDVVWEAELAAWDLTSAEAGRDHVDRDTKFRPNYLHYYWVLGY